RCRMNWTDGPATWKQLKHLRELGYKPEHLLTKTEASDMIRNFGGHPEPVTTVAERDVHNTPEPATAYHLRAAVENAKRAVAEAEKDATENSQHDLAQAFAQR